MYAGHAAIALLAKSSRPRIAVAVLVPVAFGPDWVESFFAFFGHLNHEISHSLISVGLCATTVALLYAGVNRSPRDALAVWLVYVSHWFADLITGIKPTWPAGPQLGLDLYAHPVADVVVESLLVIVCSVLYVRSVRPGTRGRLLAPLVPAGLVAMQIGFAVIQEPEVKATLHEIVGAAPPSPTRLSASPAFV